MALLLFQDILTNPFNVYDVITLELYDPGLKTFIH